MTEKCAISDLEALLPEDKRPARRMWMRFREVKKEDEPGLFSFFSENGAEYAEEYRDRTAHAYALVQEDEIIGGALLCVSSSVYFLPVLVIREENRRKKLGKIMLENIMKVLHASEAESVFAISDIPEFYRRFAFFPADPDDREEFYSAYTNQYPGKKEGRELLKYEL